jgi:hypothetical protein
MTTTSVVWVRATVVGAGIEQSVARHGIAVMFLSGARLVRHDPSAADAIGRYALRVSLG